MEYRPLGRTGVQVSKLCLGTMMFGAVGQRRRNRLDPHHPPGAGRRHQLRRHRRRLLRRRVRAHRRQGACRAAATTSCWPPSSSCRWATTPTTVAARAAGSYRRSRTRSRRLGTDYIDLYQVHRPSPDTDVEETLGALTDLVRQGKVRYIGSSSYAASQIVEAQWAARDRRAGTVRHRAAAVLDHGARHRGRRAAHRPAARHGHPHLQPARRRLAVRPLAQGQRRDPDLDGPAEGALRHDRREPTSASSRSSRTWPSSPSRQA